MADLQGNLLPSEEVQFQSKKHWLAPIRDSFWPALLIIGAFALGWLSPNQEEGLFGAIGRGMDLVRTGLFLGAVGWIVYNLFVWRSAVFAVTNLRVLRYEGLVQRRTSETLLSSVSDVKLNVGFLGRALGFGDLEIYTASGRQGKDNFQTITQAADFRNALMTEKLRTLGPGPAAAAAAAAADTNAATKGVAAPAAAPDPSETLLRLGELREKGLITPEEYEAKKTELLARM